MKKLYFIMIMCCLACGMVAQAQPTSEQTWGLCIGISDYDNPRLKLEWANKDAIDFCTGFLRNILNIPENHYKVLQDANATDQNIIDALNWIVGAANAGDRAYIFYSGHGKPDSPFLPYNSNTTIPLEKITQTLQKFHTQEIVVFADACYSGRLVGKGDGVKSTLDTIGVTGLSKKTVDEITRQGVVIMTSADGTQEASEKEEKKNGLFTYYLMEALVRPARYPIIDVAPQDNNITMYEVYQDVHRAVTMQSKDLMTLANLETLQHDGVPGKIVRQLKRLEGTIFENERQLWEYVERAIGKQETEHYKASIWKNVEASQQEPQLGNPYGDPDKTKEMVLLTYKGSGPPPPTPLPTPIPHVSIKHMTAKDIKGRHIALGGSGTHMATTVRPNESISLYIELNNPSGVNVEIKCLSQKGVCQSFENSTRINYVAPQHAGVKDIMTIRVIDKNTGIMRAQQSLMIKTQQ